MTPLPSPEKILSMPHSGSRAEVNPRSDIRELRDLIARTNSLNIDTGRTRKACPTPRKIREGPVIIFAGETGQSINPGMTGYLSHLTEAFTGFTGTLISGGTTSGICGIVGDIQEKYPDTITTIGYVPAIIPPGVEIDSRYKEIRKTDGETFSVKEPLQYWSDIIASGIDPADVKLIGIGGGDISAAEYRIALLLGAKAGILENSGRAADVLLQDPEWNTRENLVVLPLDAAILRTFIDHPVKHRK